MHGANSIHSLCRICLNQGSRDIYENNFMTRNIVATNDIELDRIAEKLRYVTLLKVNPKENLPQQICDLCMVQLNVSYNFKRLALKNDFYIRQYMIENGINLMKEEDVDNGMETSLEIHQIHNVITTSKRRPLVASLPPPSSITTNVTNITTSISDLRRNSTNSSVSGVSAMVLNGCDVNNISSSNRNGNHSARPFNVLPIQIKTEPIDPEDDENLTNGHNNKKSQTVQSSPSNSTNSVSIVTVNSSSGASFASKPATTPPMIVINGSLPYKDTENLTDKDKKLSPKKSLPSRKIARPPSRDAIPTRGRPRKGTRDLRVITKSRDNKIETQKKKKLREAAMREIEKRKKERMKKMKQVTVRQHQNGNIKKLGRPPKKKNEASSKNSGKQMNVKVGKGGKKKK